jgi:hypothetical protein
MQQTTHSRLIPCEKHAAVLGRHAARLAQREDDGLLIRRELLYLLDALRRGDMGACSADFCVMGDDS